MRPQKKMFRKYSTRDITIIALIVLAVVLIVIHIVRPSLLASAASAYECSSQKAKLHHLLSKDHFTVTGNLHEHEKLGKEIHHLRLKLHHEGCFNDEHLHMSIARQCFRLFLGMLSFEATPMDRKEREKLMESHNYKYMIKHLQELTREAEKHEATYKCQTLHMQREEAERWLASRPFGRSAEGKRTEEHYRTAMMMHSHEDMVKAGCLPSHVKHVPASHHLRH